MFSKILIKLVDEAIVPAILLIVTRILSVILIGQYYAIEYVLTPSGFTYSRYEDYVMVNSYSTLAMICVLALGLFYVLVKSLVFHETHIKPNITARLFALRLSSIMQTSFDLYTQGVVWLSYSYLFLLVSGVMAIFGSMYPWVFFVSLVLTISSTYLFVLDVEKEMYTKKSHPVSIEDEVLLTLGELDEF